ncbi:hypothetical protein FLLO111716_11345 [Flavobacterium longum]
MLLLFVGACTEKTSKTIIATSDDASLRRENDSLRKVIDSLRRPEAFTDDTLAKNAANPSGKNPVTLQWISWSAPGEATLDYLPDGSYQISGSQATEDRQYLNIMGVIRRVSDRELEFDGTVETKVNFNNGGKPCIKTGKQKFIRSGNRKYYRLQNMENCGGGNVVDYVDIYPGTSGLLR